MPLKRMLHRDLGNTEQDLLKRLVEEWRNPDSANAQPVIIEDRRSKDQPLHVYVIWDDWSGLEMVERSEVIMDAFEQVHDAETALDVTVAMGLTSSEAERMGIRY